ncbi:hypothetical protein [Paraburkholderia kururiensis]|uniref:Uncharacterized protein n=1 Tax=Paraburkholderia kururiensis TaxID=984307 RepID=A0ABZ0WHP4_9BURK|nr:hypothetical protein [Paraburkholderia kururiensis]WQD76886.1 hypothetical protein U0042_22830 [Paraburkholderia kururiensis]
MKKILIFLRPFGKKYRGSARRIYVEARVDRTNTRRLKCTLTLILLQSRGAAGGLEARGMECLPNYVEESDVASVSMAIYLT